VSLAWDAARAAAWDAVTPLPATVLDVDRADGLVLVDDVRASTDLPAVTASAMDGWAVRGQPPWAVSDDLAADRTCVHVSTGAPLPEGAAAVLRDEYGVVEREGSLVTVADGVAAPAPGQDVRPAGIECHAGDVVATRGQRVVPALVGLLAAAGVDRVAVVPAPRVHVVVTGDELVGAGPSGAGVVRDALGPMLPPWLRRLGAGAVTVSRVRDDAGALAAAFAEPGADLVVSTGSTAAGRRDYLRRVLAETGADLLVDTVAVRPGRPMLMARLADGRVVAGLPGNPLAAVSGLLTLVAPLVRHLGGHAREADVTVVLGADVTGHPAQARLVPVRDGAPLHHVGPAMLRGLAAADGLALVPPGGARAGDRVRLLALP
jgi:molybdopterin molybdotransferase